MEGRTIPTVRLLFDQGLPLRDVAAKLCISLDEARARLRSSYPAEREAMNPATQAKLGKAISAAWVERKAKG